MEKTYGKEDVYNWAYLINGALLTISTDTASKSILLQALRNLRDARLESVESAESNPGPAALPEDASTASSE